MDGRRLIVCSSVAALVCVMSAADTTVSGAAATASGDAMRVPVTTTVSVLSCARAEPAKTIMPNVAAPRSRLPFSSCRDLNITYPPIGSLRDVGKAGPETRWPWCGYARFHYGEPG